MSRPTINWKGVDSSTLPSLIITEHPPITKAEMRTETTDIPGRDGTIVDEQGYAAYTKKLQISLKDSTDIDAVIKYFTGSGDLIHSNEPLRTYKASIYSQVDYERLLRYRTAEVEFLVQPYKYLTDEENVVQEVDSGSNTPDEMTVTNEGLEVSKPLITISGYGQVILSVNGQLFCELDIQDSPITLDSEALDAYTAAGLANNRMTGDFPVLQPGENTISWEGTGGVDSVTVAPRSRWL